MEITDVLILPKQNGQGHPDQFAAFARVTFDRAWVLHVRLIDSPHGLFVAMPDRVQTDHCLRCQRSNRIDARWCNWCRTPLNPERGRDERGFRKLHHDLFHPVTAAGRQQITDAVVLAFLEGGGWTEAVSGGRADLNGKRSMREVGDVRRFLSNAS